MLGKTGRHFVQYERAASALIDGNQYVNRPGPRVVETLEIIAEIINLDLREHQHEGVGWERFPA